MLNDSKTGEASRAFHPGAFPHRSECSSGERTDHVTVQLREFEAPSTGQVFVFAE